MKVFIFVCSKAYGGGLAIVAATNKHEALGILQEEYGNDDYVYEYTDLEHCHESETLTTNVTEPKVLESDFYVE